MAHASAPTLALLLAATAVPLIAQNAQREFWPEINYYTELGSRFRLIFVDSFTRDQNTKYRQGSFTYYLEYALRPVFRRDLRNREDVFRRRYLTFRAGYRYVTSLSRGNDYSENRIIAESNAKYPLLWKFVATDRNRGDFRFTKGEPFSMRYVNRLKLERDLRLGRFVFTPYGFAEFYYYTKYGAWAQTTYEFGVEIPVGPHVVFEPFGARQHNSRSSPPIVHAFGLTLNLYF
jgi:hypothetical protein